MAWTPAPSPPWQHPEPCLHQACCLWVCEASPCHMNLYWNCYRPNTKTVRTLENHYIACCACVCVWERDSVWKEEWCVCFACLGLCIFERDLWRRVFAALNASVCRCTATCAYGPTTYLHVPKAVQYCACMNVTTNALLSRCQLWSGGVIFSVPLFSWKATIPDKRSPTGHSFFLFLLYFHLNCTVKLFSI